MNRIMIVSLTLSGVVICCLSLVFAQQVRAAKPEEFDVVEQQMQEGERIAARKEEIGKALLSVFTDKKQSAKVRLRCASVMGSLKYLPAIPFLVEQIALQDPERLISESSIENMYPCVSILNEYGIAALPDLVEGYVKEKVKLRRALMLLAIRKGNGKEITKTYVRGFVERAKDKESRKNASVLLGDLD